MTFVASHIQKTICWAILITAVTCFMAADTAHAQRAGYEEDWLGAPMYWSSFDAETNVRMIEEAGFHVLGAERETATEDGDAVTFLWVTARKVASPR